MDQKTAQQWQQRAVGVTCGNVWDKLGNQLNGKSAQARHCGECGKHVHNLSEISEAGLQELMKKHPQGLCVVNEPRISKIKKIAASLLSLLCLGAGTAQATEPVNYPDWPPPLKTPENKIEKPEKPMECKSLLFTPMMHPPTQQCLNEKGKRVDFGKWQEPYFKEHKDGDPLPD